MNDTISQAVRLARKHSVNYNPGLPITISHRPITVSVRAEFTPLTSPPIFQDYRARHTITSKSLNARLIASLFLGGEGDSVDFAGLVMIAFFQQDPEAWDAIFGSHTKPMTYSSVLGNIVGLTTQQANKFVSLSDEMFPGVLSYSTNPKRYETTRDFSIKAHEEILRTLC